MVKAGQLLLDEWAKAYNWGSRYLGSVLQYSRYSADGKTFGEGNLYGLPQVGEVVGIYYNKEKLTKLGVEPPKTWAEFEDALAKAKAAGEVPMQFGNLDGAFDPRVRHGAGPVRTGRPDHHARVRPGGCVLEHAGEHEGRGDAGVVGGQGLLQPGLQRTGVRPGLAGLRQGQRGVPDRRHLAAGRPAEGARRQGRLHAPAGESADAKPVVTGGTGLPFAITNKAKNADAAAAYINFITSPDAMKVPTSTGTCRSPTPRPSRSARSRRHLQQLRYGGQQGGAGAVPRLRDADHVRHDRRGAAGSARAEGHPAAVLVKLEADYSKFAGK